MPPNDTPSPGIAEILRRVSQLEARVVQVERTLAENQKQEPRVLSMQIEKYPIVESGG